MPSPLSRKRQARSPDFTATVRSRFAGNPLSSRSVNSLSSVARHDKFDHRRIALLHRWCFADRRRRLVPVGRRSSHESRPNHRGRRNVALRQFLRLVVASESRHGSAGAVLWGRESLAVRRHVSARPGNCRFRCVSPASGDAWRTTTSGPVVTSEPCAAGGHAPSSAEFARRSLVLNGFEPFGFARLSTRPPQPRTLSP